MPLAQRPLIITALVAFITTFASAQETSIKIGEFASLTGKEATYGQTVNKGTRLAFEEANAAGGVLGRKLELITEDD